LTWRGRRCGGAAAAQAEAARDEEKAYELLTDAEELRDLVTDGGGALSDHVSARLDYQARSSSSIFFCFFLPETPDENDT